MRMHASWCVLARRNQHARTDLCDGHLVTAVGLLTQLLTVVPPFGMVVRIPIAM